MNSLSWVIYLADLLPSLGTLFGAISWLSGISALMYIFITFLSVGSYSKPVFNMKLIKWLGVIFLATGIICSFIPNKQTIYLIVGSELGEEVIESEIGKKMQEKVLEAIDSWDLSESNKVAQTNRE